MQTKTKYTITIIAVLVISVLTITFLIKTKKTNTSKTQTTTQSQPKKEATQTFQTVYAQGEVISLKDKQLEIKNGDITNKLTLFEKVLVYTKNNQEIEKKEISDLKAGTKVNLEIDTKNSTVIAIEIQK